MTKITIAEFIELLEKNGYPWTKFYTKNVFGESCALGQVARNLGFENKNDIDYVVRSLDNSIHNMTGYSIIIYNDTQAKSYEEVVKFAKRILTNLNKEIYFIIPI